jgi:hypothetical protein
MQLSSPAKSWSQNYMVNPTQIGISKTGAEVKHMKVGNAIKDGSYQSASISSIYSL